MGRLQDFPSVTPTSSDKILIVQSQGQGLAPHTIKMDSSNPTGTGSLSLNRKSGTTVGNYSVAEGYNGTASGDYSHAEGANATASGERSHAEGTTTTASGYYSHAEGNQAVASGQQSHAEGYGTTAGGNASHAEGHGTTASGDRTHAEGSGTTASGLYSHAENQNTTASGQDSHAEGLGTIANHAMQHVFGLYNVADTSTAAATSRGNYVEIVGNGENNANRSNARTLDWSGNEVLAGGLTLGGHSSVIGTIELGTNASSVAVPDSSITEIGSITLSAGAWIILACADWAKNANGYRQIAFGVGVDPVRHGAVTTLSAGADKETYQQIMQFSTFNAQTTQKVYVLQNSGSALNVFPYIYAIRIA